MLLMQTPEHAVVLRVRWSVGLTSTHTNTHTDLGVCLLTERKHTKATSSSKRFLISCELLMFL